jgi:hypothetical protein
MRRHLSLQELAVESFFAANAFTAKVLAQAGERGAAL